MALDFGNITIYEKCEIKVRRNIYDEENPIIRVVDRYRLNGDHSQIHVCQFRGQEEGINHIELLHEQGLIDIDYTNRLKADLERRIEIANNEISR